MSRIYSNDPLSALPVATVEWKTNWKPTKYQNGPGVLVEGSVTNRLRHVISDSAKIKTRYYVILTKVRRAHRRVFNSAGVEVEPNFSDTQKIRTGFLHSSYKTAPKGQTDALTFTEVIDLLEPSDLASITEKNKQQGCVALWMEEKQLEGVELNDGDEIRLKTKGNGPFVESFVKLNAESSVMGNYADRDNVGASWTDKVMLVKASQSETVTQSKDNEGAADDEWD